MGMCFGIHLASLLFRLPTLDNRLHRPCGGAGSGACGPGLFVVTISISASRECIVYRMSRSCPLAVLTIGIPKSTDKRAMMEVAWDSGFVYGRVGQSRSWKGARGRRNVSASDALRDPGQNAHPAKDRETEIGKIHVHLRRTNPPLLQNSPWK